MATTCRSCGEPIVWERMPSGKLAPFSIKTGENHFIDCPQRKEWRKEQPTQTSFLPDEQPAPPKARSPFDV